MVIEVNPGPSLSPTPGTTTTTTKGQQGNRDTLGPGDSQDNTSSTDVIAAITIALLAVVIILTLILVVRAVRKRRRAQRGEQFGENVVPTISTGVMGSGAAAYAHSVPVRGHVSWEAVNPSSGPGTSYADQQQQRSSQQQPQNIVSNS